jgi:hypothetical protein
VSDDSREDHSCVRVTNRSQSITDPNTQYKYPGKIPLDARDAKFPPIKVLRPPEGAPNVVVILLDDKWGQHRRLRQDASDSGLGN